MSIYKEDDEIITFEAPIKIRPDTGVGVGYEPDIPDNEWTEIFENGNHNSFEYDVENMTAYCICRCSKEKSNKLKDKLTEKKYKLKFSKEVRQEIKDRVKAKEDFSKDVKRKHEETEALLNGMAG